MRVFGLSKASIVIAVVLGVLALVALAAWLGDIVAAPKLKSISDNAVDYFRDFRETSFTKPAYYSDMTMGNAWDDYSRMIELIESSDIDEDLISDFLAGVSADTVKAAAVVVGSDPILSLLQQGARRKTAAAPLDYEQGFKVRLPNFMAIRTGSKLLACRARLELDGDSRGATDDLIDGLVFAGDIAGGDLNLIGNMVGVVCLAICRRQIEGGLNRLEVNDLKEIANILVDLTDNWPPLSKNLDAEHKMAAISLYGLGMKDYRELGYPEFKRLTSGFFSWWLTRFLSWRQGFSFRRTQLGTVNLGMKMVGELALAEEQGWEKVSAVIDEWDSNIPYCGNWLFKLSAPNLIGMHRRWYEAMARARLVGAGALVQIYYHENGSWPAQLALARAPGLEDLLVDPITGQEFRYVIHPGEDSVSVYSLGTDLIDDGGVTHAETADLVLVLHCPARTVE